MGKRFASIRFFWGIVIALTASQSVRADNTETVPNWIWAPDQAPGHIPQVSCFFRKTLELPPLTRATLAIAADDQFELYVNGQAIGSGTAQQGIKTFEIAPRLRHGDNTIAVKVSNLQGGTAGLAARLEIHDVQHATRTYVSDASWKCSLSSTLMWNRTSYSDRRWKAARSIGQYSNFVVSQAQSQLSANNPTTPSTGTPSTTDRPTAATSPPLPGGATAPLPLAKTANANGPPNNAATPNAATPNASADGPYQPLTRQPAAGDHLQVPREFELEQLAGHADIGSATAMTFNELGQLIVAQEDGQLWLLADRDQDGRLDSRRDYGKLTKTCQGLLSLNGNLFVTGLGEQGLGLFQLRDTDQDGQLDQVQSIYSFAGENIEHGPHGVTLGPDGMLYVMVGNHSPPRTHPALAGPYRSAYEGDLVQPRFADPGGHAAGVQAPGGYVLRVDVTGSRAEIVAGGLRNAYDLTFNAHGELFTHDSDMESDRGTTWYRPTRLYHIVDGAEFGWRSGWAVWPDYYLDSLPGAADTGRGSPTGMVVYDHATFPSVYRHAIFSGDWSEGRVWVMPCREVGASYQATPTVFLQGQPLNVTDLDVGPDGSLYLVTGGRGTSGNVYRVTWKGNPLPSASSSNEIDAVVRHPQLQSSWARQQLALTRQRLADRWPTLLTAAAVDINRPDAERIQALQIMQWVGPQPSLELLAQLAGDRRIAVRRSAAYLLGLQPLPAATARLNLMLTDPDPIVRRRVCEALARHHAPVTLAALQKQLTSSDRHESWAARRVLEQSPVDTWREEILTTDNQRLYLAGSASLLLTQPSAADAQRILLRSMQFMEGFVNDANFIDLLRVQQLAIIRGQLAIAEQDPLRQRLISEYPSSSATINRELIRLLTHLQAGAIIDRYLAELEQEWPIEDKLHLAMHLTYLKSGWTTEQKLAVFQYLASPPGAGNGVSGYLQNAAHQFGELLSAVELTQALELGQEHPGSALAALLQLPEQLSDDQLTQLLQLDESMAANDDETSRRVKIGIIATLARDGRPAASQYLRTIYDRDPTRRVEAALGMAETDDAQNVAYLIKSLPILEPEDAKQLLIKLRDLRTWPDDADSYRQVILAAERLQDQGALEAIALLERWQGYAPAEQQIPWQQGLAAWKGWFRETYPNETLPTVVPATQAGKWDEPALLKHLARAEQERLGSSERGLSVFTKAQCASCHRHGPHGESMGPDLSGVAKRFLTRELLESILYPSKVISDQYAAKIVTTTSGKVYTGLVAQGPGEELTVLQTNGTKVRLPQAEVDEIEPSSNSAMPAGLLDSLTLEEVTDLFAFLKVDPNQVTRAKTNKVSR